MINIDNNIPEVIIEEDLIPEEVDPVLNIAKKAIHQAEKASTIELEEKEVIIPTILTQEVEEAQDPIIPEEVVDL